MLSDSRIVLGSVGCKDDDVADGAEVLTWNLVHSERCLPSCSKNAFIVNRGVVDVEEVVVG